MDRNSFILRIFFSILLSIFIYSCSTNKDEKKVNIYDLPGIDLSLSKASGDYYFIPESNVDEYPNYHSFKKNKGDSLTLKIGLDSTFKFNSFYYDSLKKIDSYTGKVINKIGAKGNILIPFPDGSFNVQSFVVSERDTFFYYHLKMEKYLNFEYKLFYKKR